MRESIHAYILWGMVMMAATGHAQAPAGYYSSCEGKGGRQLLQALHTTMGSHTNVGYDGLWAVYETSDVYPDDGKVWDMYSTKHWTVNREQCGNYSNVGDCYNREHSFPKSWFSKGSPMVSDAFHIYPTDGKVNGQRSNNPYGECSGGTTLPSHNGIRALGKLGASTFPGYSGTVFEPVDEYKGDFARSYFYMAAAYYDRIANWDSPMLAGNQYPAFSSWAVNLLLKWHRQDPVSSKEVARNNAVYAYQHNRNPFIDHPEMVEYIWGNMQQGSWESGTPVPAEIQLPIDGSTLNLGVVAVNNAKSADFVLKGAGLSGTVSLNVNGDNFTVSPSSVAAADVNATDGVRVTVGLRPTTAGVKSGKVTIVAGQVTSVLNLRAEAVEGLYAYPAANISDRSFTASWIYVGDEDDSGAYTLHLTDVTHNEQQSIRVNADEGEYDVEDLEADTDYEYWLTSKHHTSNRVALHTGRAIQSIQLLYEGELHPEANPGERSISYEIIVDAENITEPIVVEVDSPFALSTDKSDWTRALTMDPQQERFYLSMLSDNPGEYTTEITLTSGDYCNTDITVTGTVLGDVPFLEDFEADADGCSTYDGCEYRGTASLWYMRDAGIWESDSKYAYTGRQAVRMGKTAGSTIEMREDKHGGIGRVSLWASRWSSSDGAATFRLEVSTDGGNTWMEASTSATVDTDDYTQYTFDVNVAGDARLRVVQTEGHRFMIDDLQIGNYSNAGLYGVESDYHSWDAFCRGGRLLIESRCSQNVKVYGLDGTMHIDGAIGAGITTIDLAPGLYIVSVADFTRVVLVK